MSATWIKKKDGIWACSKCGKWAYYPTKSKNCGYKYCPNCREKMDDKPYVCFIKTLALSETGKTVKCSDCPFSNNCKYT